ncbi:MAG TPA: hypothetical protein VMN81_10900 [Vicinamibacterales bacterium]|nr:hypothetical protein [Vicinamibacterales bacterium]
MALLFSGPQPPEAGTRGYAAGQLPGAAPKLGQRALESLEQTKLRYEKEKEGIWLVTFEGRNLGSIPVYVIALDDMLVVSATVMRNAILTAETLRALLSASYEADFAKVAVDKNGHVVALTELGADFNTATLHRALEHVAELADTIGPLVVGSESAAVPGAENVGPGDRASVPILRGAFELVYDPVKWREDKTGEHVRLYHREGDAFVTIIDERIEISLDGLRDVAMQNARAAASDVTLLGESARQINGLPVRIIRYSATATGVRFTFLSQLYGDKSGSVQLAGVTGANLMQEYEPDFLELFAGFRRAR